MIRFPLRLTTMLVAAAAGLTAAAPAGAQEGPIVHEYDAVGLSWEPAITALYVYVEEKQPVFPDDGPPEFPIDAAEGQESGAPPPPPTPEKAKEEGLVHLTLNVPPADRAPTIATDWVVYNNRRARDEQVSALIASVHHGKRRLWLHRCYEDEYIASYPVDQRLFLAFDVEILQERFAIPNNPTGDERRALIRKELEIVGGRLEIREWNKLRTNGQGGEEGDEMLYFEELAGGRLAEFVDRGDVEFIIRRPTVPIADLSDRAIHVLLELELQAGKALGFDPTAQRRKIQAEIRFVAKDMHGFEVDVLSGESEGGEKKPAPDGAAEGEAAGGAEAQ